MTDRTDIILKAELAVDDAGEITGIAWPFGTADKTGDIIERTAFKNVPADLPILLAHDPEAPIGLWSKVEPTADGLIVQGKLDQTTKARAVRTMLKSGLIGGLSIGFINRKSEQRGRNRVIHDLDLLEISVVRNPAHPGARVTAAKTFDASVYGAIADAIKQTAIALKHSKGK